jgi:hypothetical protein
MTMIGTGLQIETKYVLTGPDGTRVVFNDHTDPDYVGRMTNITGLDSPEVRESAEDLVEFDGGVHGAFYYGRRPVVIEGLIYDHGSVANRNDRMARISRASNAMRGDALLAWTPDGGVPMFTSLRRQQPLRFAGGWNKTFQMSMVAADPRIYSAALKTGEVVAGASEAETGVGFPLAFPIEFGAASPVGQVFATNDGNAESFPLYYIYGPGTNPSIENFTTGSRVGLIGTLGEADVYIVDTLNRTVSLVQRDPAAAVVNLIAKPVFPDLVGNVWGLTGSGGSMNSTASAPPTPAPSGEVTALRVESSVTTTWMGVEHTLTLPDGGGLPYSLTFSALAGPSMQGLGSATIGYRINFTGVVAPEQTFERQMTSSGWDTMEATIMAPSGATGVTIEPYVEGYFDVGVSDERYLYFDSISFVQSDTPEYGDGTTPGWTWDGTPFQSTSSRLSDAVVLESAVSRYSQVDFANTDWGGLAPGTNDLRLLYSSSSAGAKLRVNYRDAWL